MGEFVIEEGAGYSLNERNSSNLLPGFLAVDAVFMPVKKVNFFVETARSRGLLEMESLILEVHTNGSITPSEAINDAAHILENTFSALNFTNSKSEEPAVIEKFDNDIQSDF